MNIHLPDLGQLVASHRKQGSEYEDRTPMQGSSQTPTRTPSSQRRPRGATRRPPAGPREGSLNRRYALPNRYII